MVRSGLRRNQTSWWIRARWLAAASIAALTACAGSDGVGQVPVTGSSGTAVAPHRTAPPELRVERVASGLEHGWDIGFLPDGKVLISQRPAALALLSGSRPGATTTRVAADLADVMVRGEGGLLGMVIHPDFASSRRFTTCQTHAENGEPVDIRLVTWRLSADGRSATRERNLLTGLPVADSGRHSGCRPTIAADGYLLIGTGDTAHGDVPQDLTSLGGKVLRLDLTTGKPAPDNPFADAADPHQRFVYSYGHRNVQGVAVRPGTGQVFTAEHGPTFDDEVNLIRPGANYGWDPSRGGTVGGYDESVPMTDRKRFPSAVNAVWQSGETTQAVCAAAFLSGPEWGAFEGTLVVTALKGSKLLLLSLDDAGAVTSVAIPPEFDQDYGRLRAARLGPDHALYVTTSNGKNDLLLRVTPG